MAPAAKARVTGGMGMGPGGMEPGPGETGPGPGGTGPGSDGTVADPLPLDREEQDLWQKR